MPGHKLRLVLSRCVEVKTFGHHTGLKTSCSRQSRLVNNSQRASWEWSCRDGNTQALCRHKSDVATSGGSTLLQVKALEDKDNWVKVFSKCSSMQKNVPCDFSTITLCMISCGQHYSMHWCRIFLFWNLHIVLSSAWRPQGSAHSWSENYQMFGCFLQLLFKTSITFFVRVQKSSDVDRFWMFTVIKIWFDFGGAFPWLDQTEKFLSIL